MVKFFAMSASLFNRFVRASDALVKFNAHFSGVKDEEWDIFSLETHREELLTLWAKTQETFEECLASLQDSEEPQKSEIESVDGKYDASHRT